MHPMLQCQPLPCFNQATSSTWTRSGRARSGSQYRRLHGGTGGKIDADWILHGYDGYMPLGWYCSDPGAKFNASKFKAR